MEEAIRDRYNSSIYNQALDIYQIDPKQINELDGFESYIYAFERDDGPGILRISHSIRRSPDLIRGELDWINYLNNGGASVARPITSRNGILVEEINDDAGGSFLTAAFEKAPGEPHHGRGWSQSVLFEYGRSLGLIHQLSRNYQPTNPDWKRPQWDDPIMLEINRFLPADDLKISMIFNDLLDYLRSLPRDHNSFGLIHQDAHRGNFFIDKDEKITLFDFDDCVYSWYIYDIALVLFYAVMGQEEPEIYTNNFLKGFLPGYYSEVQLDPIWFMEIPFFMKLREIDLYAVIHRSFDINNLDDPWCAWYMNGRKEKIESGKPYLDYDFNSLKIEDYLVEQEK